MNNIADITAKYSDTQRCAFLNIQLPKTERGLKVAQIFKEKMKAEEGNNDYNIQYRLSLFAKPKPNEDGSKAESPYEKFMRVTIYKLIGALNKTGIKVDESKLNASKETLSAMLNARKAIANNQMNKQTQSYIEQLMSELVNGLTNPQIIKLSNSIKAATDDTKDIKAMKAGVLTGDNPLRIIAQWKSAGRKNTPTYVATVNQWANMGRYIKSNAVPLIAESPYFNDERDYDKASQETGINDNTYNSYSKKAKNAYEKAAKVGNSSNFIGVCYFDISDTFTIGQLDDDETEYVNNVTGEIEGRDKAKEEEDNNKKEELAAQANLENSQANDNLIKKAIYNIAKASDVYQSTAKLIKNNAPITSILQDYFSKEDSIFRDRNENSKKLKINLCCLAILKHYSVAPVDMVKLYQKNKDILKSKKGLMNVFVSINNLMKQIESNKVTESKQINESNYSFDNFLQDLGLNAQEYNEMPNNEEVQDNVSESTNCLKENFMRIMKRMENVEKEHLG